MTLILSTMTLICLNHKYIKKLSKLDFEIFQICVVYMEDRFKKSFPYLPFSDEIKVIHLDKWVDPYLHTVQGLQ